MKKLLVPGLTIGALMLGIPQVQAATITLNTTIDDFSVATPNPTKLSLTGKSSKAVKNKKPKTYTNIAPPIKKPPNIAKSAAILGGEREFRFQRTYADAKSRSGRATIDPNTPGTTTGMLGTLTIDNGTGFNSKTSLLWNGIRNAGLNANLSDRDFLAVEVEAIDLNVNLAFTLLDNDSTATVSKNNLLPGKAIFSFSEFTGIDFSQIKSIQLDITGPLAFDAEINFLSAQRIVVSNIPEPSTLVGILLVGGLGTLTRKKKASKL
ncbi:MAG: PEP-CTERM sorting domain-containing protein [Microcystaceae cyanobacterium]